MANEKRAKAYAKKQLGRHKLNRKDILILEKILRKYANAYEIKKASVYGYPTSPPAGRRNMPRKYANMHVRVGGIDADSVKFLPKCLKSTRYLEVNCRPGILITFTPLKTTIASQENYATGFELMTMRKVVGEIEEYLSKRKHWSLNHIRLVKH